MTGSTVTHHLGTQAVCEDDAGVHLVWTTDFAPASLLDYTTTNMRAAAELMKTTIDTAYANQSVNASSGRVTAAAAHHDSDRHGEYTHED